MKRQYSHELITSFYLWFDHKLLEKAEAYKNKTGLFYEYNDKRLTASSVYGSPYPQFVYDNSIAGANMISGVYDSSENFIGRGTSGLNIDHKYGRAIFANGNDGLAVSGSFAIKDFNTYISPRKEEFLFEEAFGLTRESVNKTISYADPYKIVAPCAIIKYNIDEINEPFAFGGEDWTKTTVKVLFISDNYFKIHGAMSAMKDTNHTCFSNITGWTDLPLNYYGDLKSGTYDYNGVAHKYKSDKIYVEKVFSSQIMEGASTQSDTFYVGYLDFDLGKPRFPRQ